MTSKGIMAKISNFEPKYISIFKNITDVQNFIFLYHCVRWKKMAYVAHQLKLSSQIFKTIMALLFCASGGWVAPNIYYMGYANVITFAGIRICGLSGIYKSQDFTKGHFEVPPYSPGAKHSVYHVRNLETFRLAQIKKPIDIMVTHDWPVGVYHHGNKQQLIR